MDPVPAQPPRDKKSVDHEYAETFLRKLFANGSHFEESFCKICDSGCRRYADVAELLEQGCLIEGKQKNVPRFLTAEGLVKLHQRWGSAAPESN